MGNNKGHQLIVNRDAELGRRDLHGATPYFKYPPTDTANDDTQTGHQLHFPSSIRATHPLSTKPTNSSPV